MNETTPVEFAPEQYAVLQAAIGEAFKKGVESVPQSGPKNSFVNCNVNIHQSEDSYEPEDMVPVAASGSSNQSSNKPSIDEEQDDLLMTLARLGTPAEILRMVVALSAKLQADISSPDVERSIHRQTSSVFKEGMNKAHEALVLAAKGDTSVERIYNAALDVLAYAFVTGQRNGVWDEVSIG